MTKKKRRLNKKARYTISIVLIILAVIMVAAAVAINNIEPPSATPVSGRTARGGAIRDEKVYASDLDHREGVFTALIVGTDAASRSTDTIMLATFDTEAKKMNILSIPRDTIVNAPRATKKINAAYAMSDGDIYALYDEVESVTGIRPDRYVLVTVDAFVELIDAIGGVEVDVPIDMHYKDPAQDLTIDIEKGLQTLDGYDSMGFMRYRATYVDGDLGRIKVQHMFIEALIKKMLTPATFARIPELAQIVLDNLETDLTLGNEIWLGRQILSMNLETDVNMYTLPGHAEYYNNLSYYFPDEEEALAIINEYYNPYTTPIEKLNLFRK
ncbi:MAG: LCP family protein [Oscillospiraceae bacterium]|nr:LCP family protein [Oscillospiraceae bacterium]